MGKSEIKNPKLPIKKDKFDFKKKKENTVRSLFEVENFLCNFKNIAKGLKLYHILRK